MARPTKDEAPGAPGVIVRQVAVFPTEKASRYLQQLCKHFAHKVTVEYDKTSGRAELPGGEVTLSAAPDALTIDVSGEDLSGFLRARFVVEEHLLRFAFREKPGLLTWRSRAPK